MFFSTYRNLKRNFFNTDLDLAFCLVRYSLVAEMNTKKTFDSFKQFRKELRLHTKHTHHRYVTAKSQLNADKSNFSTRPYKMKYYKCEKHVSTQCNASLRVCLKGTGPNKNKYMITRLNLNHNHQCHTISDKVTDVYLSSSSYETTDDEDVRLTSKFDINENGTISMINHNPPHNSTEKLTNSEQVTFDNCKIMENKCVNMTSHENDYFKIFVFDHTAINQVCSDTNILLVDSIFDEK